MYLLNGKINLLHNKNSYSLHSAFVEILLYSAFLKLTRLETLSAVTLDIA
jgi:hypothetical protein